MRLKYFLGFLCILSALSATGYSLSCKVCTDMNFFSCDGPSEDCPADSACGSSITMRTEYVSAVNHEFTRSCVPKQQCDNSVSFMIPNGVMRKSTSCCFTDDCTPPLPAFLADGYQPNGVTCPTCMSATSTWCNSEDTMQCAGSENMCLLQTTRTYAPVRQSLAVRGCATESMCSLGTQYLNIGNLKSKLKFKCVG
ncbi:phospholipase A2 inhibitor NAI-like [Mixophyes fleayi]|uniref:phospholipase A2 inhibitor NAI-like n=1 Tax=Mixophyes fleayi TaxID=3061075 RepID=UPI003F4DD419